MSRGPNETGPRQGDDDDDDDAAGPPPKPRLLLHVGLFLATFLTTTATGALAGAPHGSAIDPIRDGLPYSVPLMFILLCHELGHYIVARLHGVPASLPYFIPLPPGPGPRDAGRRDRHAQGRRTDRKQLIDIGAAGPLAGLVVAIPILVYGLMRSEVGPLTNGTAGGKLDPVRRDQVDREGRLAAQQPERRVPASDRARRRGRACWSR